MDRFASGMIAALCLFGVGLYVAFGAGVAGAREQIRVVGSSTVFPFAAAVAEQFGRSSAFRTPVVESTGSGGGLKRFCAGVGLSHPDVANVSRRIKASEVDRCVRNGVSEIVEIKFGFDGIVLANSKKSKRMSPRVHEGAHLPSAREAGSDRRCARRRTPTRRGATSIRRCRDARNRGVGSASDLGHARRIRRAGDGIGWQRSRSRCSRRSRSEDKSTFKRRSHTRCARTVKLHRSAARERQPDRAEARGSNPDALGIFGFSFLDQNTDSVQASIVEGVEPTFEHIAAGDYGVSRSLYFYVKKAHVGLVPGLEAYIAEFTSDRAAGEDGYLMDKGLIPLSMDDRREVRGNGATLATMRL